MHPDQNTADEAKEAFLQLQLALETLSDPTELNKYRLTVAKWLTSVRDVLKTPCAYHPTVPNAPGSGGRPV